MNQNAPRAQIAVAAQDAQSRARLIATLRSDPILSVVGEAQDELGLFSLAQRPQLDILLLDSILARRINRSVTPGFTARIILLADHVTQEHVVQALHFRAYGIVPMDAPPQVVLRNVRTVLANEYCMEGKAVSLLLDMLRELLTDCGEPFSGALRGLTTRELNVAALVATGHSNREAAEALSISERTIKHHLTSVFAKLGISSRLQLANIAINAGLIRNGSHSARQQPTAVSTRRVAACG